MDQPKLIVIHTFFNPNDAHIAKSLLLDAEIPATIFDESSISSMGYNIAIGGYRIAVPNIYSEDASKIINEFLESIKSIEPEIIYCPKCHSSLTTNRPVTIIKILLTLFITNILLRNSSPYYTCKRCRFSWNINKGI